MATILVVDDEEAICRLLQRVLEKSGHRVITCQTAAEALSAGPVDLLLVDLILPEVNGRELADKLRERWPKLPVVLMSGYLAEQVALPDPPSSFLQKPMLPTAIVNEVERLLGPQHQ